MPRVISVAGLALAACTFGSPGGSSGVGIGDTSMVGDSATSTGQAAGTIGTADDTAGSGDGATSPTDGCAQCSPNASCGVDGSCTCNPGWVGDGASCVVDATLADMMFLLPCLSGPGGGTCNFDACQSASYVSGMATLTGDPLVLYEVTLHFRGVVELKSITGGVTEGNWNEGGTPAADQWNLARLLTGASIYHLNAGPAGQLYVNLVDYMHTITIPGGTNLTLEFTDVNTCANYNKDISGVPISVPGVTDPVQPYNGQFLRAEVVSIVPLP